MMYTPWRASLWLAAIVLGGCAQATIEPMVQAPRSIARPDMIIVNNFAVTPSEVRLDEGVMATAVRDSDDRNVSQEESRVGHIVADRLAAALVEDLRNSGIAAFRASSGVQPTPDTIVLNGQFLTVDQGNQTMRVWVGFGLGGSELRTRIQAIQNGRMVAEAQTATKSSLKPGMLTSLGVGAAADSGAVMVAGAAGTGISEAFLATVDADAKRTAREVANKIRQAYVDRGWFVPNPPAAAPVAAAPVLSPAPTMPEPVAPAGHTYTVKAGDTLYNIARTRYGDGKQWPKIVSANPGLRPETLKVGQTITLP